MWQHCLSDRPGASYLKLKLDCTVETDSMGKFLVTQLLHTPVLLHTENAYYIPTDTLVKVLCLSPAYISRESIFGWACLGSKSRVFVQFTPDLTFILLWNEPGNIICAGNTLHGTCTCILPCIQVILVVQLQIVRLQIFILTNTYRSGCTNLYCHVLVQCIHCTLSFDSLQRPFSTL